MDLATVFYWFISIVEFGIFYVLLCLLFYPFFYGLNQWVYGKDVRNWK